PSHAKPRSAPFLQFFRDCKTILASPQARRALCGQAVLQGMFLAGFAFFCGFPGKFRLYNEVGILWLALGGGAGCLLAGIQGHPLRALGLVPLATTGLIVAYLRVLDSWDGVVPCLAAGILGGLILVPLRTAYLAAVPANARASGVALLYALSYFSVML